jgi:hypothetical protein
VSDLLPDDDVVAAQRREQAHEIAVLLKRVLATYRSYAPEHEARRAVTDELFRGLGRFTGAFGDLVLQITSKAFFFEDEPLVVEEDEEDATTRPLFIEGIQALTFTTALVRPDLERLLVLWHVGANARFPDGRSLATEIWESDFTGIETRMVENFSEGNEGDDGAVKRQERREELTVALTEGMNARALPGGTVSLSKGLRFVSGADLLPLTMSNATGMSDELLERLAAARRNVIDPLTPAERERLITDLTTTETSIVRAHRTLWTIAPDATEADQASLAALVVRISRRFLEDGSIDLLRQGLTQTLMAARVEPNRAGQIAEFLRPLASPEIVAPLVAALRDATRRGDAAAVLAFLDPASMGLVLDRIDDVVEDDGARTALLDLVARKGTTTELFVRTLAGLSTATAAQSAAALLETLFKMRPGAVVDVLSVCLAHASVGVRRAALARVPVDAVPPVAASLADAFMRDRDADVRRDLLGLLMRAKSPAAIGPLLSMAQRGDIDVDERQSYLRAIAAFGVVAAPLVAGPVRQMFDTEKDIDVRAACVLVLGSVGDDSSRALLETESRRLFGHKTLKTACVEALKRLDARTGRGRA